MIIGVTSENKIKINSVKKAYNFISPVEVKGYSAKSGVGEQPVGNQTLLGATNRINCVNNQIKDLDRIVSIENGIFFEENKWLDKAVVVIYNPQKDVGCVAYSDAVIFPTEFVEKAKQIGFDTTTVSQVMYDAGYISNPKDPHLSISGISRQVYLENTIKELVNKIERN